MMPYVFIGSSRESIRVAEAIQHNLQHDAFCVVWTQGIFELSKTTLESLVCQLDDADYAVFVFTPDDIVKIRDNTYSQARDNVLFEFGLFTGRLGRDHTFFVMPRETLGFRIPSDLLGVTPATYDSNATRNNLLAAVGPACTEIKRTIESVESERKEHLFLRSRAEVVPLAEWPPTRDAKDMLFIGHNLFMVARRRDFFEQKLKTGTRIKCLIADRRDENLISTLSRGVVETDNTRLDFTPALKAFGQLHDSLVNKSLFELRAMDYVPTLSFQVLDGEEPFGTILVELTPNKIAVTERPHFILSRSNPRDRMWYDKFLANCREMYDKGREWDWTWHPAP